MGARMVPANGHGLNRRWVQEWCQQMDKLQKLKKSFICRFGWKIYYYKYIHFACNFCSRKGGACFYWVPCFYWDIYGIHVYVHFGRFTDPEQTQPIWYIHMSFSHKKILCLVHKNTSKHDISYFVLTYDCGWKLSDFSIIISYFTTLRLCIVPHARCCKLIIIYLAISNLIYIVWNRNRIIYKLYRNIRETKLFRMLLTRFYFEKISK